MNNIYNVEFKRSEITLESLLSYLSVLNPERLKNVYLTDKYIDALVKSLKNKEDKKTNKIDTVLSYLNKETGMLYVIVLKRVQNNIHKLVSIKTNDFYYQKLNIENNAEIDESQTQYLLSHTKDKTIYTHHR